MEEYHKKDVESSLIKEIKYNTERNVLEVRLRQENREDRVYFYENVPKEAAIDFLNAESYGSHYNKHIKNNPEFGTFGR